MEVTTFSKGFQGDQWCLYSWAGGRICWSLAFWIEKKQWQQLPLELQESKFRLPPSLSEMSPERSQTESPEKSQGPATHHILLLPAKEMASTSNVQGVKSLAPAQRFTPLLEGGFPSGTGCFSTSTLRICLPLVPTGTTLCSLKRKTSNAPWIKVRLTEETQPTLSSCPRERTPNVWWYRSIERGLLTGSLTGLILMKNERGMFSSSELIH